MMMTFRKRKAFLMNKFIKVFIFSQCLCASVVGFLSISVGHAAEINPKLSLSVSEQYNDNVLLQKTDRKGDFETSVSPGLDISLQSGKTTLSLGYTPGFNYYIKDTNLDNTSHNVHAAGTFNLSDATVVGINDTFMKSSEISDLSGIANIGPVRVLTEETVNNGAGNVTFKLSSNLNLVLGGGATTTNIKGTASGNSETYTGNAGLNYTLSERTTVSGTAGYSQFDYEAGNDSNSQNYGLGLTYVLTPTVTLGLNGGLSVTQFANAGTGSPNFNGSAALTKKFQSGTASISFAQSIISSAADSEPMKQQQVSIQFARPLTESLSASLMASYSQYNSIKTSLANTALADTDTLSAGAGLTYKINTWADLALNYSYLSLKNRVNGAADYSDNVVMLKLTIFYDRKF